MIFRQHLERRADLLGQIRLLGEFAHGPAFEEFAVERTIHVAERKQSEQLGCARIFCRRDHLRPGQRKRVTSRAKLRDEIGFIPASRAVLRFRQEIGSAAAHEHVGLGCEILLDDTVVFGAPTGMRHHGCGGGVLDLGIGDDADRHVLSALRQAGDGLDPGIVERVGRTIGIDTHGIDRRFVAGGISAGGIRRVGDDRIAARRRDQGHVRHVVDGELAERLPLRNALSEQARRDTVRGRHAVADEQDDILRLARPGIVHVPAKFAGLSSVRDADVVDAGVPERNVAQEQGGLILAGLAFDKRAGLAEDLGVVLAVQGDRDL